MKKLTAILCLVLISSTVFGGEGASQKEREFLCKAVQAKLVKYSVTASQLADDACSDSAMIESEFKPSGAYLVKGTLKFTDRSKTPFQAECSAAYAGQPTLENMGFFGGVDFVYCEDSVFSAF